jgi:hypothetical protein
LHISLAMKMATVICLKTPPFLESNELMGGEFSLSLSLSLSQGNISLAHLSWKISSMVMAGFLVPLIITFFFSLH